MERYEAYKDSGVEWIGEIPAGWHVRRIKEGCAVVAGATPKSGREDYWGGDIPWITPADYSDGRRFIAGGSRSITERGLDSCGTSLVPAGSIIVSNRAPIGLVAVASRPLCTNQGCKAVIPASEEVSSEYLYWYLLTQDKTLNSMGRGTTFAELSTQALQCFLFPFPPLYEQQAIADYLDAKTAEIDLLVSDCEREVELLREYRRSVISEAVTKGLDPDAPMKDTGIEWIGEIPEDWILTKTLYGLAMAITDGPHETPEFFDEGIPFISAEAVSCGNGRIDFDHMRGLISEEYYIECSKKYVPAINDIFMIKSGASTGRVAIVDTDKLFTIWSPLAVFRCNEERLFPKYLFYYLQSEGFQKQVEDAWTYGTQQNIGMRTLERLQVCYPNMLEQIEIANHLDSEISRIDNLIDAKKSMAEKLREYRRSLISEAVTGKFKVPGV